MLRAVLDKLCPEPVPERLPPLKLYARWQLTGARGFESFSLQRRVSCEPGRFRAGRLREIGVYRYLIEMRRPFGPCRVRLVPQPLKSSVPRSSRFPMNLSDVATSTLPPRCAEEN